MNQGTWLDKLERKFGRYSIRNLMTMIVAGMGLVYILDFLLYPMTGFSVSRMMSFSRSAILHGQIWRLVTFILIPPNSSLFFILLSLYFYWMIGSALENQWGSFRFNVFYLCGMLGAIAAGLITGYTSNSYLNLSLFLAFALIYPDYQVLVFFILPVKMKYLALLDAVGLAFMFIGTTWSGKVALLISLINVILFFWRDIVFRIKDARRRYLWRKNFKN